MLSLVAFVRVEARTANPLLPRALFTSTRRNLALLTILLASAAGAATNFFLSLFLQQIRGLTPLQTSAYFLPMLLIAGAGTVAGRWMRRAGPIRVAAAGLAGAALGLLLLALWMGGEGPTTVAPHLPLDGLPEASAVAETPDDGARARPARLAGDANRSWRVGLAGLIMFPFGLGLSFAGAAVAALGGVPDHRRGVAGGVVNTAMEVGPTVGLAALVALSRVKADAMVQTGASWARATTAGYSLALATAASLFALLAMGLFAAHRRATATRRASTNRRRQF